MYMRGFFHCRARPWLSDSTQPTADRFALYSVPIAPHGGPLVSAPLKLAFIGCGRRALAHAPGVKAEPRLQVVALADPKAENAAALNEALGTSAPVFADYHDMLDKAKPDVVISALWTPLHLPVFRDCVAAGVKGVLSEKPMAPTWADCRALAKLAEDSGVLLTFCHQRRFAEGNRVARRLINEGAFGEVTRLDLFSPPHLLDCGTHTFDQAFSFLNETPVKWVLGGLDATKPIRYFDLAAETMAVGTVVYENGVRASFQVGGPDRGVMQTGVRVVGTGGFLEVLWDGEIVGGARFDDPAWRPPTVAVEREAFMVGVVRDATECLLSGAEPELSWRKALRAAEVIFAIYESIRRHARVELPLTGVDDNPFTSMLDAGAFADAAARAPS